MSDAALITGASSGIGLAVARRVVAQGYNVLGIARDAAKVRSEVFQCESVDLSQLDEVERFARGYKEVPALVLLSAGFGDFGSLEEFSRQRIEKLVTTNLTANLVLLSHLVPKMKRAGRGDIVIVGSESALQGARLGAPYCASKFGLRGMAQSLRAECSTSGVRVMMVHPGPVSTSFFDKLSFIPESGADYALSADDVAVAVMGQIAQPRTVNTDELQLQPIKKAFKKRPRDLSSKA